MIPILLIGFWVGLDTMTNQCEKISTELPFSWLDFMCGWCWHGTYFWRIDHRCLGDHPLRCRFSNFYYFSTMKNCFVADVLKNLGSSASFLFVFSWPLLEKEMAEVMAIVSSLGELKFRQGFFLCEATLPIVLLGWTPLVFFLHDTCLLQLPLRHQQPLCKLKYPPNILRSGLFNKEDDRTHS